MDPTRDIETLVEDDSNLNREDVISRADTEDEPQLGSVFPSARSVSDTSFLCE